MRNLIYILLILLTATTAQAQSPTRGGGNNQLQSWYGGFKVIRYLAPPNTFNPWTTYDSLGMVWIDSTTTKKLMWHTGVYRRYVASERYVDSLFATAVTGVTQQTLDDTAAAIRADITSGSTDSAVYSTKAYRQKAVDSLNVIIGTKGSGTVTSVATNNGTGITGGAITGTGTIAADTTILGTRAWRNKGLDSVAALVDATVLPTANKIVRRDANANAYVNNLIQNGTSTAAANGTTAMTLASTLFQEQTGSSGNDQTYVLPDATTLTEFTPYVFDNNSDGAMVIKDHTNVTLVSIGAGGKYEVRLKDNGSVAGTWDKHPYLALGTNASTAGIQFTGFVSASGSVTGSNLSGTNTGDQTISLTGDVTGSGTGSFAATLANTAVSAGSYTLANITVDAKGRITAASNGSVGSGTVTSVATNTGTGITGGTITTSGTIAADTFILDTRAWRDKLKDSLNAQDALRVKYTDTASMLSPYLSEQHASVTYVAIVADTTISAAYTLTSRDYNRTIHCTNGSNIALTIPTGLGTTFTCVVLAEGAGTVTPTTSSTTFYYQPTSTTKIKSQGGATIRSWATANSYLIIGSLE